MRAVTTRTAALGSFIALGLLLSACSSHALQTNTNAPTSAERPVVVAIGDSIMKGHGLDADKSWPAMLATTNKWDLTNLACDGAGFVATGDAEDCGADFSGLIKKTVALRPDLILISGSSNDLGADNAALASETDDVVQSLRSALPTTTIVGISTVWNDTATPDQMDDINEQVRAAVKAAQGLYLDIGQPLAGHRSWLQSDDVHPTVRGQNELAKVIAGSIRGAKLSL